MLSLKAIRRGVTHIERRYLWSGTGEERLPEVLSIGHRLVGPPISAVDWKYYYVHFGRQLALGEVVEVRVRQRLHDTGNTFEPVLSKVVDEPISLLCLRVVLPKGSLATEVDLVEEAEIAKSVLRHTKGTIDPENGEARWDIPTPRIGRRYSILWCQ